MNLPQNILLKVDHLTMQFGGLLAVNDLTFDVKRGEIFGLIGPNGAGKTTVFNCITQFYKPTKGQIYFQPNQKPVIHLNKLAAHEVNKQGLMRTFQNVELIWELTVLENLMVAATPFYQSNLLSQMIRLPSQVKEDNLIKERALNILHYLGLWMIKDVYPYGLPYGYLKRIELARTLMNQPELIILDEPAAGLNDAETQELAFMIKRIRDEFKTTIFLVEHDMGLVMSICDTVCAISFGKMLAIGSPKVIQQDALVREAYLGSE